MEMLSSSLTDFMKYWLLPLWTLTVLAVYLYLKQIMPFAVDGVMAFIVWLTVDVVIFWNMFSMKKVSVDDTHLYVTGFKETRKIPLTEVEYVSGSRFALPEQVWFRTKDKKITVFMPKIRLSFFAFQRHPTVEALADRCGLEDDW